MRPIPKRLVNGVSNRNTLHQALLFNLVGGADRDRTDDLRLAKPALSQLSYSPALPEAFQLLGHHNFSPSIQMVGLGRVELPTSPLSGVRSNQLSYRPVHTS